MVDSLPQPDSLILVAFVPLPRDLEIARILGWYRIPLRTAPKVISVDYLAFYQPASFGEHKWCIEMVAPVQGHELVTRAELIRDEPDHPKAREEYFKIQLGSLVTLPNPIRAEKWKRITFLYTTGRYLLAAEAINDLVVHSDERKLLWQSLRERAEQGQEYTVPEVDIPPEVITNLLGIKDLGERYDA
jgi:hypothetical protein